MALWVSSCVMLEKEKNPGPSMVGSSASVVVVAAWLPTRKLFISSEVNEGGLTPFSLSPKSFMLRQSSFELRVELNLEL